MRAYRLPVLVCCTGVALIVVALGLAVAPRLSSAAVTILYVAPGGDCGDASPCYEVIQQAIDAAHDGDVIKVAAGTYEGVNNYGGLPQAVYLYKNLAIQGGYTTGNWDVPDPNKNPTTLDAQGQGRVIYVVENISSTIEGLRLVGGDATGLGGRIRNGGDAGGGIYVANSTVLVRSTQILSNSTGQYQYGAGVYFGFDEGSPHSATLRDSLIKDNGGANTYQGGGLHAQGGTVTLARNSFVGNAAYNNGTAVAVDGFGMNLNLDNNSFSGNIAFPNSPAPSTLYVFGAQAQVSDNSLVANLGGGVWVEATFNSVYSGNVISGNLDYGVLWGQAGNTTFVDNTIAGNGSLGIQIAEGGSGSPVFRGNTVSDNSDVGVWIRTRGMTCAGNTITQNRNGGIHVEGMGGESWPMIMNNMVCNNRVDNRSSHGSGIHISGFGRPKFVHNTVARNIGGDGTGIRVNMPGNYVPIFTNTILVSHTIGVYADSGSVVKLEGTLWGAEEWANRTDWAGDGVVITGTWVISTFVHNNHWVDPLFVDPDAGDYHIALDSPAIDKGSPASLTRDIDGDPRPMGNGLDIGCDETGIAVTKHDSSDPIFAGSQLTYVLSLTNTTNVDLRATVTDILPAHVTPTGYLTWTPTISATGGIWTNAITVRLEPTFSGTLTNVVHVTTAEGPVGHYTETTSVLFRPVVFLPIVMR